MNQMILRIEPGLKEKVGSIARSEGKSLSQVIRELLRSYVHDRDIEGYVDDLWDRMGQKLRKRGVKARDVSQTIRLVRRKH